MPAASRLISPALSMSWWLTNSASAGASFRVDRKNRDTRMICFAFSEKPIF
jgi:hypothetical protein